MMSKVIIAGGRDFGNRYHEDGTFDKAWHAQCWNQMSHALNRVLSLKMAPVVVSGMAKGADDMGVKWALDHLLLVRERPADWDRFGRGAGYVRNEEMAIESDILVAFWDRRSRGTRHMIDLAMKHGLEVHVFMYEAAPDA